MGLGNWVVCGFSTWGHVSQHGAYAKRSGGAQYQDVRYVHGHVVSNGRDTPKMSVWRDFNAEGHFITRGLSPRSDSERCDRREL
jgi:hypothetical protein